jgi:cadmium resistance protein CadD (predicted permease)
MKIQHPPWNDILIHLLIFLIPVNIYVIGEWLGTGVQWALFRYQQTYVGNCILPISNDFEYISLGIYSGKTALSVIVWFFAVILIIISLILLVSSLKDERIKRKYCGGILIGAGILFLASCMIQYGLLFNGPAGICIPIGVPAILIAGWWMWSGGCRVFSEISREDEEHDFNEDDPEMNDDQR